MKKNVLAIILALCMVIAMLPAPVFAAHNGEQLTKLTVPTTVGELESAVIEPNAKSYTVSLSGGSNGTTELLVNSPAEKGSEVYFVADPDDGYLAEIYFDGLDAEDFVYIGMDIWGFIMPGNKVTLQVEYVAAEGEEHSISVYSNGTAGQYAVARSSAKKYESVLLAVYPSYGGDFSPTELVWAFGTDMYYLFEEDGIYYYEIIMGDEDVGILLTYSVLGTHKVKFRSFISNGTVTVDNTNAVTNKEVFLYVTPDSGFHLEDLTVKTESGGYYLDVNYIREEAGKLVYSFIMPPCNVEVNATFRANTRNVTVNAGPGGTASANVTEAKVGSTVTVTCTPDDNYRVYSITGVDGLVDKGNNVYEFVMPDRDVAINVTFRKIYNPITVTVDTGLGGTASADLTEARAGDIVTLLCVPEEGYRVAQITGVDAVDNGDNTYTFTMPDAAADVHVLFLRHENPFVDVNETHFFYDPVLWAVENGITNGIDTTHFGPFLNSNRAAVVTMLWRWAGSPEPNTTENPFTDVPAESWYTKAVLWAVENGITNGMSPTTFGPTTVCNRAQVVTFLYRYLDAAAPEGVENPFVDVPAGEWYEAPVLWALANGVTTGADATHFNPAGDCLRAQFVTFLYRASLIPRAYELHWVINGFQDTPSDYGTVTLSHSSAVAGEVITATVVPAEGYVIDWVKCEFGSKITQVSDTEFTFVMPEGEEIFHVNFVEATVEPEPEPTDPEKPQVTYSFVLKDNGFGKVSYRDGVFSAAPGESIFFYAVPDEGYYLTRVEIFNPNNEIDISKVLVYSHGDDLYELVMIDHDVVMTCVFEPIPNT